MPSGESIEIPVAQIAKGTSISSGTKMVKGGEIVKVYKK